VMFSLKTGGRFPHLEDESFEGVKLMKCMFEENERFWESHQKIQPKVLFDKDFI